MRPRRCLLLAFVLATSAGAALQPGDITPWQLGLAYAFNEAEERFARDLRKTPGDRMALLGRSAALLNVQPRSADHVAEAHALLEQLVAAQVDDDAHVTATYLLARIADVHQQPRDPQTAARLYRSLLTDHTAHPLAQAAGVKLALILLYDTDQPDVEVRFTAAENLLTQVSAPGARSDLLVILGRTALHFERSPADALRWFAAARDAGFSMRSVAADTLVALAQLAAEAGNTALERESLAEFVDAFPRDNRAAWLRQRLESLAPSS